MRFNSDFIFRGKHILSCIEKNERLNQVDLTLDFWGNKSILSMDEICLSSFLEDLSEYAKRGKVSHRKSEGCFSRSDLNSLALDFSEDKRFSVRLELGDLRKSCDLIMRVGSVNVSLSFNEFQLSKILSKFKKALEAKEARREAEEEAII